MRTLERVLRAPSIEITCAGRTDAGVHAWGQVVSFDGRRRGPRPVRDRRSCSRRSTGCAAPTWWCASVDGRRRPFDARFSATLAPLPLHGPQRPGARPVPATAPPGTWPRRSTCAAMRWPATRSSASTTSRRSAGGPRPMPGAATGVAHPPGALGRGGRTPATASSTSGSRPTPSATRWSARSSARWSRSAGARSAAGDVLGILAARDRHAAGDLAPPHGLCLWDVGYDSSRTCERRARSANCPWPPWLVSLQVASALGLPRRSPSIRKSKGTRVPTYTPKASEIERAWYVVDAEGLVLGRMATEVARILRGKHKPTFAPHIDTGDHVIIINADKVVLTAGKAEAKMVYRHSGYPGGIRSRTYAELLGHAGPRRRCAAPSGACSPRTASAGQLLASSRSTPARPTPTPPSSPSRSRSTTPRRAVAADDARGTGTSRCPSPSPRRPVAASAPSPASASAPAPARSPSTSATLEDYFPSDTHRMILTEPLRLTEHHRGLRRRRHARRRRLLRPGRRPAPRHRPGAHRARPRAARRAEEGRLPHPRRPREGIQEVRPQEGPQGAAVLEALIPASGRCRATVHVTAGPASPDCAADRWSATDGESRRTSAR